jgi:hypothetical protein
MPDPIRTPLAGYCPAQHGGRVTRPYCFKAANRGAKRAIVQALRQLKEVSHDHRLAH